MNINALKNKVLQELSIEGLPEKEQEEILAKLTQNILQRVSIAAFAKLSPMKRIKLSELAKEEGPGAAHSFLAAEIPDFESFVQQEIKEEVLATKKLLGE